ncbi:MAG: 4-hydroxy-tetrahydrodipicolinate synthase [Legionellales bacterium RIFCSPHIGHO2_12_FULL_42_9]|nr:MAG: 4-hydroxy-tetrahydrodipicolinate synthase [Legionellales bacterium RIFCSPHIGHO2_12_FULL_42_9]
MFQGSMVALVTPMLNGKVDLVSLRGLVDFHVEAGTRALIAAGTTGEAGTLSYAEKCLVIQTVMDAAHGRVPVIAGTAMNATNDCIELTRFAMLSGAYGALIMTPAYIKPTQEGLYQHYSAVAQAVPIPIILYNVPSRTACDLLPETVIRLSCISNIVGIKEATGRQERLQAILNGCAGRLDVYSGDDLTVADWMLSGARGAISVTANVAPKHMAKLCDAGLDGNRELCLQIQAQLLPLNQQLFVESNPIPVKWAMAKMGLMRDELRLPLVSLSAVYHQALSCALHDLALI